MARGGCGNEVMVVCRVLAAALGVAPSHAQQDSAKTIGAASLNEVMVVCRVLVAAMGVAPSRAPQDSAKTIATASLRKTHYHLI